MSVFGVVILAGISCHLEWCFHSPIFSGLFMTQTVILLKQRSKKTWVRRLETGIETTEFQRFACAKLCFVYTLKNALPCCLSIEKHNVLLYQINCYRNVFVVAERYERVGTGQGSAACFNPTVKPLASCTNFCNTVLISKFQVGSLY